MAGTAGAECPYCRHAPEPPGTRNAVTDRARLLTRREREVWLLVGAGLANREIARRLFVSVPTVKKHVSATVRKLGAGNRAVAARLATVWHREHCPVDLVPRDHSRQVAGVV